MSNKNHNLTSTEHGIAGAASGIFTRGTCQPFDVVKIRFQIQTSPVNRRYQDSKYRSMLQTAIRIRNEEGLLALWKGHIPAQWLSLIYGAAQFATYEQFTKSCQQNTLAHFASGALSGTVAVIVSFPFDVIRTRLVAQGEPKVYNGMIDITNKLLHAEGWRGLFKGLVPACIQNAPMSALVFGFNHILTTSVRTVSGNTRDLTVFESLCCGSIAGFTAKTIIYPFDLIKKRLQLQGMPNGLSASGPIMQTSGLVHCFRQTLKLEGIRGLYKGLAPSVVKAGVSYALYLTSYNKSCQYLSYLKS